MIVDIVLFVIYGAIYLLTLPLRLFDNVSTPVWFSNMFSQITFYLSFGKQYFPYTMYSLILTWGVYIAFEFTIFTYKGIRWVYRKFPGIT